MPNRKGSGSNPDDVDTRRDDRVVVEEPLALYVVEDDAVAQGRRDRRRVVEGVLALRRAVVESSSGPGSISPPMDASGPPVQDRHWLERAITRHLHTHPLRAQAAFDRWLVEAAGSVVTRAATLRLDRPLPPDLARLRVVPARLELRHLPVPARVELELVAWGGRRAAVSLRPSQRRTPSLAWHNANRYFAGAHAVMDQIMRVLRADVERRA